MDSVRHLGQNDCVQNQNDLPKSTRGGSRKGAGRKPGPNGAGPTRPVRLPESWAEAVEAYRDDIRERHPGPVALPPLRLDLLSNAGSPLVDLVLERAALTPSSLAIPGFTSRVAAGFPSPADDYLEDGIDLNRLMVTNPPATFFYTVEGDSMDRAGILPGDRVIVDRSIRPKHGDIVIAVLPGEGHTIKRLHHRNGAVRLDPDSHNPRHQTRTFAGDAELILWGVVTGCVRRFRR